MEENFQFNGMPENFELEIPEKTTKTNGRTTVNIELEDFLNALGDSVDSMMKDPTIMQEMLGSSNYSATGMPFDPQTFFNIMTSSIQNLKAVSPSQNTPIPEEDDEIEDFEMAKLTYLRPEFFGTVMCDEDPDLYEHFTEKYGVDSSKYLDDNIGIKNFEATDITAALPLNQIKNLKFVEANEKFILFYAEPEESETYYGFFVAVIRQNGEYCLYIPEFSNTFKYNPEEETLSFYSWNEKDLFLGDDKNFTSFIHLNICKIELAIKFALATEKKTLITPVEFGKIKNLIQPVQHDSQFLKIGNITSNESSKAVLLKKDADLDISKKTFPLYFRFPNVIDKENLVTLSTILFKVNFNESEFMKNTELQYTNGKLFVDVDFWNI